MEKTRLHEKFRRVVLCMAVAITMLAASKAVPAYASDFTTAVTLPTNGAWTENYELVKETTDYYKFTISSAGSIDLKIMSYVSDLDCTLYDSNFNNINSKSVGGSETSPQVGSMEKWLSQGTYYVTVSSWRGKSGNYKLYISFASSGMAAAEKDSFDLPRDMSINSKATGVFTHSNQEDWYKVTIPVAGKYNYVCQRSAINGSSSCLYDSNLSELSAINFYYSNTETKEIMLNPGTYYIKFQGKNGGTYTCQLNDAIPAKGEVLIDTKSQAEYKVTKAGRKGGTVTYLKSTNNSKTSITIPSTIKVDYITYKVTGIASGACRQSNRLNKVTIGKNVTSIGAKAFAQCSGLSSITIPANVKSIGKQAFYQCSKLKKVTIKTTKLTSSKVGTNAFKGTHKKTTVKVPKSKFRAYKRMLKKKGFSKKAMYR